MTNNIKTARGRTHGVSPALSDVSELTVLSRSPSPVPDYGGFRLLEEKTLGISPTPSDVSGPTVTSSSPGKLRSPNGRFVARHTRRAPSSSPERPAKRPRRLTINQQKATLKRTRKYAEPTSPKPEPTSSVAWVTGKGGFGALEKLPTEIRQEIYAYTFDTHGPVTLKSCCGPTSTARERDACRKHGLSTSPGAGRFNILQVTKAMRSEAMWVIFNQGTLFLSTTNQIAPYIEGFRSKSQRSVADFIQNDKWKRAMWNAAGQFRCTTIDVPETMVQYGDPTVYTQRLLGIATFLCKEGQHQPHTVRKSVHVHLGSVFHQMLPFNMESQGEARYGELLDWLCVNYPTHDPDLDKLTVEAEHNLQRLLAVVGKHAGHAQWRVFAKTQIHERDEGGAKALFDFQVGCARNGVVFEHTDCSPGTSYWK